MSYKDVDDTKRYSVPAVERTIRIFHYLKANKRATGAEIAKDLSLTRSNCYAILKTLQLHGFVLFDIESKKYSLGPIFLEFVRTIVEDLSLIHVARPYLQNFVENSGLSVVLEQRVNFNRLLVIDRQDCADDVRVIISIGTRIPITHSASGRALLAYLPSREAEELVNSVSVIPLTPKTMTDPAEIIDDLKKIRARGYAVGHGENLEGIDAIAAPIFDVMGEPIGVIACAATTSTLSEGRLEHFGNALRSTSDEITVAIGGKPPK
ncbi:IclR family transcriptional regulator [Sneathiella litorea]|uniref:Helix-turn-helix domain-containing protein n=1 Tax=Sneathiella litorea TaxID=2606216 RepID=A0A6L8W2P2_9PROT|nr:IclR family transcriptional regulator [Sneathiella litorea]MZR29191.1 helix-turn-helix domain-containing protein [Sneathiella litorea]